MRSVVEKWQDRRARTLSTYTRLVVWRQWQSVMAGSEMGDAFELNGSMPLALMSASRRKEVVVQLREFCAHEGIPARVELGFAGRDVRWEIRTGSLTH